MPGFSFGSESSQCIANNTVDVGGAAGSWSAAVKGDTGGSGRSWLLRKDRVGGGDEHENEGNELAYCGLQHG